MKSLRSGSLLNTTIAKKNSLKRQKKENKGKQYYLDVTRNLQNERLKQRSPTTSEFFQVLSLIEVISFKL